VHAEAEFTLDAAGLGISMRATAEAKTLVNLAHHSYFNLGGAACLTILDHELELFADERTPGAPVVPDGRVLAVAGTPFDFRRAKRLGQDPPTRDSAPRGYDDNYLVRGAALEMRPVARLHDPGSGRTMHMSANQPAVQFYTGLFLDGSLVGKGRTISQYSAICLETQAIPNAINVPAWRDQVILEPGRTYRHEMRLAFSAE
jgi:aldose 1-epimerase